MLDCRRVFMVFPALAAVLVLLPMPALCQVVPPAPQALPTPLTLPEAIAIALRQQPQQYTARAQITQAQGQRQEVQAQYFPTFIPTYQYQNRSQSVYGIATRSSITSANEISVVRGGGLSFSLNQNIYDSGARETSNAEARRALEAANYNFTNTRQGTVLAVTQDFYQLLLQLDLVKVAQAQVARYQQAVDVTQAQIDAGTVAAKDIFQSRADLANAQVTLLQDQNQVRTASAALKNAMGVDTDMVVQPAPLAAGNQLPPLPPPGPDTTLDASLAAAYANRPDLRQQQAVVASDRSALQQAQRNAGFTLSSSYLLNYQATNDAGLRGLTSQFLLTGSYPLFDAGSARGAVRVAQGQRDIALNQLEQTRQQIRLEVEQAFTTRSESLEAARLAQAAVTAAQVNYDATVASRREGIGTVQDITTAQATLTQAQNQYVTAIYNFYIADAQLLRAVGRNDVGR